LTREPYRGCTLNLCV